MMDIKIYQINLSRDDDRVAFLGLSQLDKFQESSKVNSEIYDKVFEGAVEADTLEGVYQMFNCDCPEDFQGHSLSVSDVVEIVGARTDTGTGYGNAACCSGRAGQGSACC